MQYMAGLIDYYFCFKIIKVFPLTAATKIVLYGSVGCGNFPSLRLSSGQYLNDHSVFRVFCNFK